MGRIKEPIVMCEYCRKTVIYEEAYPCVRPPHSEDRNRDYYICSSCLEQQFCEGEHEQEEGHN